MGSDQLQRVAVQIPVEVVGRLNDLKQDRAQDRGKSVEELITEFCQTYIAVREMARQEAANREALDRSYEDNPNDMADGTPWTRWPAKEAP